jgi:hypothetical protein
MADLFIEHTFAASPADYARLYFDESFSIALAEGVRIGRTLLRLDRDGPRLIRHVRCEPVRDLPAPVAKLLAGRAFHYREEIEFDLDANAGRWRVVPSVVPDKVDASGTLVFTPEGSGVRRTVRGGVSIGLFGVGALVERFVVAEVVRSYEDAATCTRRLLAERAT